MMLLYCPAVLVAGAFVGAVVAAAVAACERFSRSNMLSKGHANNTPHNTPTITSHVFFLEKRSRHNYR